MNSISISSNYSLVKVLAAIARLLFGIATLYDTKADQIPRYGFAAFGLTVVPCIYVLLQFARKSGDPRAS